MDTIFAVSSGTPPAAIAVLRISGPYAFTAGATLCRLPAPRHAALRRLVDPVDGTPLDRALVLTFPGPRSATGQDLLELHLHGGRAVVSAVEAALTRIAGLRPALPGEFTRRALQAGIIDLTEAEGLGDLLAAETETQRRAALLTAEGGIRRRIELWSTRLVALGAQVEAQLDFSDEDDVPEGDDGAIAAACGALAVEMATLVDAPPVERLKDGIRVVLAGPPNSGKSTLLNALADRDAAIVSPIAGTTRDRIDVPVSRNGIAYVLTDTAGLTETADPIEAIGVSRAQDAMATADILLWLGDAPPPPEALAIHARGDLPGRENTPVGRIAVSATTGNGLATLWTAVERQGRILLPQMDQIALNQRQRALVSDSRQCLSHAAAANDLLVIAEDLRLARNALDAITGRADTEALLDALFGTFCIGK